MKREFGCVDRIHSFGIPLNISNKSLHVAGIIIASYCLISDKHVDICLMNHF